MAPFHSSDRAVMIDHMASGNAEGVVVCSEGPTESDFLTFRKQALIKTLCAVSQKTNGTRRRGEPSS